MSLSLLFTYETHILSWRRNCITIFKKKKVKTLFRSKHEIMWISLMSLLTVIFTPNSNQMEVMFICDSVLCHNINMKFIIQYDLEHSSNEPLFGLLLTQGPALLTLKSFYLKAFSRKHGCDWLMLKHQPITARLSAKSFNKLRTVMNFL